MIDLLFDERGLSEVETRGSSICRYGGVWFMEKRLPAVLAKFVMLNLLPVNYATFNLNHNTATVSLSERSSSTWGQLYMLKISWFKESE